MRKAILFILFLGIAFIYVGCNKTNTKPIETDDTLVNLLRYGPNYDPNNAHVDHSNLYGMGYLFFERRNEIDGSVALQAMKNLGVKSYRVWMHFSYMFTSPENTNQTHVTLMQQHVREALEMGFQIIGMNHYSYQEEGYFSIGKERRIDYDNPASRYSLWLDNYEKSWYELVKLFPEITYWEIDNEINNPDFMFIDGQKDAVLTIDEMVKISADMLYRASKGIHKANPKAITVMGGLVDSIGLGLGSQYKGIYTGTMEEFLEKLYDAIESGEHGSIYYDDFFQVAAWHPYYYQHGPDQYFIDKNLALYDIVKSREGKDKKVFLSEFGWNPRVNSELQVAEWIESLYTVIEESLPFVESLHYYIMFNRGHGGSSIPHGLFYDPVPSANDYDLITLEVKSGEPRPMAYAYQRVANGNGTLKFNFLVKS